MVALEGASMNGASAMKRWLSVFLVGMLVLGCSDRPMKRPVSVIDVGDYRQFTEPFNYRPDQQIVVWKDEGGLSFMSTMCTYDLALLKLAPGPTGALEFTSNFSTSRYSQTGEVLSGPSKFPLPFYKARYGEAVLGGPKTSVYVEIPGEASKSWRLPLPAVSGTK